MSRVLRFGVGIAFALAALGASGQDAGETERLKVYLSPRVASVCLGEKTMIVDVLVVNEGTKTALVDPRRYAATVAISKLATASNSEDGSLDGQAAGTVITVDQIRSSKAAGPIRLKPKQAFHAELPISLSTPFFKDVGLYHLIPRIGFGTFQNAATPDKGVIFELRDCE